MQMSIYCLLTGAAILCLSTAEPTSQPTSSQPKSPPTTQREISPILKKQVEDLISLLGDKEFQVRERAQRELKALPEEVWPLMIERIPHENEEINDRIIAIVGKPSQPAMRVELAVRMLASGDPDRIEKAVYMLFENPTSVCDLFEARTKGASGVLKLVAPPVCEQLITRKKMTATLRENLPRFRQKNPAKAEELIKMDEETNWYSAAAAYESALDALAEESQKHATSQPG